MQKVCCMSVCGDWQDCLSQLLTGHLYRQNCWLREEYTEEDHEDHSIRNSSECTESGLREECMEEDQEDSSCVLDDKSGWFKCTEYSLDLNKSRLALPPQTQQVLCCYS